MFVLRTALGDFQVGTFKIMQTSTLYMTWIFWIILVIINTVIFLNFCIAVISDVYEQVMQTRQEEVFQKKAEILVDLDEVFGHKIKPVLREIRVTRQLAYSETENENWVSFVTDIKNAIASNQQEMNQNIELLKQRMDQGFNFILSKLEQQQNAGLPIRSDSILRNKNDLTRFTVNGIEENENLSLNSVS